MSATHVIGNVDYKSNATSITTGTHATGYADYKDNKRNVDYDGNTRNGQR